jgi:DNA polymerase III epsilon subunit family exonuclease
MDTEDSANWIAFDLETTGLSARWDRIVEIGAVRFDARGRELGRYERLLNPGRPMPPAAQRVHGISDADLAEEADASVVLPEFMAWALDAPCTAFLAHNASFDAGFFGWELSRLGIPLPSIEIIDTLPLARRRLPALASHRLGILAWVLGLDQSDAHRALSDARRVMELWLRLDYSGEPFVTYRLFDPNQAAYAPVKWDLLACAMSAGLRVRIEYAGGTHGSALREITPRRFVHKGGAAYLVAFCHLDDLEKSFRLDRVLRFEVVESARTVVALPL